MAVNGSIEDRHGFGHATKRQKLTNGMDSSFERSLTAKIFVPYRVSSGDQIFFQVNSNVGFDRL